MRGSVFFSLILHLAALAGLVWGAERGNRALGPPVKVYGVEIVGAPGRRGAGVSSSKGNLPKPSLPTPKTDVVRPRSRTGLKVETAPSTDPFAPKGTKKPARTSKQKPEAEGNPGNPGGQGAPAGGGGGIKIEGDLPFPYQGYIDSLQARIQERWEEPLVQERLKATVFFRILRDGTITDFRVESPSEVLVFDRSALDAVVRASPVPPLPGGFRGDRLGVYFVFEN